MKKKKKNWKKWIIKSLKMEKLKISPFFPIVKELHHLHKPMGKGSNGPVVVMQHDEPLIMD